MRSRKRFLLGLLCLSVFFGSANKSQAKSVYAITDHHSSTLKAYDIQGDKLEYQADVEVADYANGAIGIAICSRLERIFVTYEDEGKIVWADSKTLKQRDLWTYAMCTSQQVIWPVLLQMRKRSLT